MTFVGWLLFIALGFVIGMITRQNGSWERGYNTGYKRGILDSLKLVEKAIEDTKKK